MVNQDSIKPNRFHKTEDIPKSDSPKNSHKGRGKGLFLLLLLVLLGGTGVLLE